MFLTWPDSDRAKVIAFALDKSDQCPMCGTSPWQWEEDPEAFSAVLERCPGCAAKDVARDQMGDVSSSPGASVVLIPHAVAKAQRDKPRQRPASPRERAGKAAKSRAVRSG